MKKNKLGKFKLSLLIAAILSVLGLSAIGKGVIKGLKVVKISKTIKSTHVLNETDPLKVKNYDDIDDTNIFGQLNEGVSKINDAASIIDDQEAKQ